LFLGVSVKLTCALRLVLTFVALSAAVAGCSSSPASPSSGAFSQTDLKVGTGTVAASGNTLTLSYTGWFYDASKTDKKGLQFDASTGRAAFTITLGAGSVIQGWDEGLVGMRVGGVRRLIIPPSMAYGSSRYASIPPNTTLVFEIELLAVQ
jgi:FKBP-type peptidyl-prolyl cis-trans isomerase FkpA